ncbi:hypothetical protein VP01_1503g8 [Puccinia sorghi]|uniref:SRP54-type proteins GTP-binding domain-containing protein n=1 Tax=Puccinia sorghi TaxID=27349 RepID=A0A0L6VJ82_9BASI|nr:hypothetical protein VP01_1503g8 [Puccinia sorghi]
MLDHVHIFHRGGLVLWSKSFVPTPSPLRTLIGDGLIGEKSSGLNDLLAMQVGSYSLQWNLSNEFGLIFVVAYQRILQLTYITDLLESMKSLFTTLYSSILDSTFNSWIVPEAGLVDGFRELFKGWDQSFHKLLKDIERMSDRKRGGMDHQKTSDLEKKAALRQTEELQSLDEQHPTALTTATDAETIARNIAALKARKKHKKSSTSRATSRSGTDTDTAPVNKLPASNKKIARKWDNGKITANDIAEYDFSEKNSQIDDSKTLSSNFIDKMSLGTRNQKGLYQVADYDRSRPDQHVQAEKPQPTLFSKILSSIPIFGAQHSGPIILREEDVKSMIEQIQLQLMKTNVAREIAVRICERIHVELIGQKLSDRSTSALKKLINHSLEISLTKILTPKTSVDILADIHQKQERQKQVNLSQLSGQCPTNVPYVMTFVGVMGSSGSNQEARNLIELCENGYGKDAVGIAKEAIQFAKTNRFDEVLIDTAGRMQDNEPLMRALGKFESSQIHVAALVVGSYSGDREDFSHHLANSSLGKWVKEQGIPALYGVDTRALTKKIRETGVAAPSQSNESFSGVSGTTAFSQTGNSISATISCANSEAPPGSLPGSARRTAIDHAIPLITSSIDAKSSHQTIKLPGLVDSDCFVNALVASNSDSLEQTTGTAVKAGFLTLMVSGDGAGGRIDDSKTLALVKSSISTRAHCNYSFVVAANAHNVNSLDGPDIGLTSALMLPFERDWNGANQAVAIAAHFNRWPLDKPILADAKTTNLVSILLFASLHNRSIHVLDARMAADIELICLSKQEELKVTADALFLNQSMYPQALCLPTVEDQEVIWEHLEHIDTLSVGRLPFDQGKLTLEDITLRCCENPARILHLPPPAGTYVEVEVGRSHKLTSTSWSPLQDQIFNGHVHRVVFQNETVCLDGFSHSKAGAGKHLNQAPMSLSRVGSELQASYSLPGTGRMKRLFSATNALDLPSKYGQPIGASFS